MKLKDKVALVTGSARGIGKAIAIALAREGCYVFINNINIEPMDSVVEEIKRIGSRSISVAADVCDHQQASNMINRCVEILGRIDISDRVPNPRRSNYSYP